MCVCVCVCACVCVCVCESERERERERVLLVFIYLAIKNFIGKMPATYKHSVQISPWMWERKSLKLI